MNEMFLLADIGNTTIDIAPYYDTKLIKKEKIFINDITKIEEYIISLQPSLIKKCLISSVNNTGKTNLITILDKYKIAYSCITPDIIDKYSKMNNLIITNSSYLGADLFCDVIASGNNSIIIDLGTVGKIIFIDKNGLFHGCMIFPDIVQFPLMMGQSTDLLKAYDISTNPPIVSLKTEECMSSGAINGVASLVAGVTNKIKEEYNCLDATVYLTGGNSYLIKNILKDYNLKEFIFDLDLSLKGLLKLINIL